MGQIMTDQESLNPYQSPGPEDPTYYAEDFTIFPRATIQKLFSPVLPWPMDFGLACFFRATYYLGIKPGATYAVGPWSTGRVVEFEELPSAAISKWAPYLERLRDLGYKPVTFVIPSTIGAKEHAVVMLLDSTGRTVALLEWIRMVGASGIEEIVSLELDSYRDPASDILTGGVAKVGLPLCDEITMEGVEAEYFAIEDTAVEKIDDRHQQRIAGLDAFQMTPEVAIQESKVRSKERFEAMVKMGLLRPITPEEVTKIRACKLEG
ncbi:MAG: hypothetical protein WDZ51_01060 [Pirellulaceae bacterium]